MLLLCWRVVCHASPPFTQGAFPLCPPANPVYIKLCCKLYRGSRGLLCESGPPKRGEHQDDGGLVRPHRRVSGPSSQKDDGFRFLRRFLLTLLTLLLSL